MSELDPITGPADSTLSLSVLAERVAMERALREQGDAALREIVDERASSMKTALDLQAKEYERRLESLNGEAGRLAKVLDESVPREVFENYKTEHAASVDQRQQALVSRGDAAIDTLDKRLDELTLWRSGVEGRIIGISAAIGVFVIIVNVALKFL